MPSAAGGTPIVLYRCFPKSLKQAIPKKLINSRFCKMYYGFKVVSTPTSPSFEHLRPGNSRFQTQISSQPYLVPASSHGPQSQFQTAPLQRPNSILTYKRTYAPAAKSYSLWLFLLFSLQPNEFSFLLISAFYRFDFR